MTLFSIDVDAHLKKAASHTFGSPSHYPVELVRAALRRGARKVDVRIGFDRVQVTDDGPGMDKATIDTLRSLLDPAQPAAVKEAAVESVQTRGGFGLLALFAASPSKIRVENVSVLGKTHFLFQDGKLVKLYACDLNAGTRITLFARVHRDMAREKQVLRAYCRSVQQDIRLNNRLISREPQLSRQMASLAISSSGQIAGGVIGIPHTGDLCRIRLLDRGIPYRHATLPPYRGFVFEAAVEDAGASDGEITKKLLNHLVEFAVHLYKWLGRNHAKAPSEIQARIEELIFTYCRLTASVSESAGESLSLLDHFSLFKVYQTGHMLSFSQVVRHFGGSAVYAVPRHREKLRYNTTGKTVLSLTREQADFLVNHKKLPITFLSPVLRKERRIPTFLYKMNVFFKGVILSLLPTPSEDVFIPRDELTNAEQGFIDALNGCLSRSGKFRSPRLHTLEAVMVSSGRPFPSIPPKNEKREDGTPYPLLIRRHHRLVEKAVRAVEVDPANVEIFAPLLIR